MPGNTHSQHLTHHATCYDVSKNQLTLSLTAPYFMPMSSRSARAWLSRSSSLFISAFISLFSSIRELSVCDAILACSTETWRAEKEPWGQADPWQPRRIMVILHYSKRWYNTKNVLLNFDKIQFLSVRHANQSCSEYMLCLQFLQKRPGRSFAKTRIRLEIRRTELNIK